MDEAVRERVLEAMREILLKDKSLEWVGVGAATWSDTYQTTMILLTMLYAMRGRADESPREFLRGLIDDDGRNSISVSIATIMDRAQKGLPLPFRDQWAPPEGRETPLP